MDMNNALFLMAEEYSSNDALRLLVKLAPYGSVVDNKLAGFYTKERERRLKVFYDELAKGKIELTEETILSDDFLHKYYITIRAALETKRNEKITFFARLLKNSNNPIAQTPTDYYEDFVKVLDDLTFQELFILKKLRDKERELEKIEGSRLMINKRFYRSFKTELANELNVSENEILSIFIRLGRTGCINLDKSMDQFSQVHDSIATTDFFNKLEILALSELE